MNNNDVIRRIRYIFDLTDAKMIEIFASAGYETNRQQISAWLKKDDDPDFVGIYDKELATFLNGFINEKRGKREGEPMKAEKTLNNNLILRKIKIALNLKNEDLVDLLKLIDFRVSKHEISAFFRKPGQRQYRLCKDQFLRNILRSLQLRYKGI
jgi:uncharacterized protein YehS (DUF1456 family)